MVYKHWQQTVSRSLYLQIGSFSIYLKYEDNLEGVMCTNVDDFLFGGLKLLIKNINETLGQAFTIEHMSFSWGRRLAIFTNHWTTNDLNVARHKSITIICFFLSVITRINYISIFFHIYLKDSLKNFVVIIWTIHNSYCKVQTAI